MIQLANLLENYISDNHTGVTSYDDMLSDDLVKSSNYSYKDYYKFEKGLQAKIVMMSPKDYYDKLSDIFGEHIELESEVKKLVSSNIDKYEKMMRSGVEFDTPYLDYANHCQEGRHRVAAVSRIIGPNGKIPVVVVYPTNTNYQEIYQYALLKYPEDPMWAYNYVIGVLSNKNGVTINGRKDEYQK